MFARRILASFSADIDVFFLFAHHNDLLVWVYTHTREAFGPHCQFGPAIGLPPFIPVMVGRHFLLELIYGLPPCLGVRCPHRLFRDLGLTPVLCNQGIQVDLELLCMQSAELRICLGDSICILAKSLVPSLQDQLLQFHEAFKCRCGCPYVKMFLRCGIASARKKHSWYTILNFPAFNLSQIFSGKIDRDFGF